MAGSVSGGPPAAGEVPWVAYVARRRGMRYEVEADERWLRAWEPFATLRSPLRYEHALLSTGAQGSLTVARFVVGVGAGERAREASAWIVIAQDPRLEARAAATSDPESPFAESLELVAMPRRTTGDPGFDGAFASFAPSDEELRAALTPSLRKLVMGWRVPLHLEIRRGGFVLAPVVLPADPASLEWLVDSAKLFGDKAAKRPV